MGTFVTAYGQFFMAADNPGRLLIADVDGSHPVFDVGGVDPDF
jgi:hypothetical protein